MRVGVVCDEGVGFGWHTVGVVFVCGESLGWQNSVVLKDIS